MQSEGSGLAAKIAPQGVIIGRDFTTDSAIAGIQSLRNVFDGHELRRRLSLTCH